MQKFKHKSTGDIAELVNDIGYRLNKNTIGLIPKEYIENSSDWEKIIEKDYEILEVSLKRSDKHFITSTFGNGEEYTLALLNCEGNSIHSIKRVSDGEIFTIGDTVQLNDMWGNTCKIKKINIYNNKVSFTIQDETAIGVYRRFKDFKKTKPVLFTTEDGVDIFKNNTSIFHVDNSLNIKFVKHKDFDVISKHVKYFSTKEKAEEYVLMNKPCLSINDVLSISYNPIESKISTIIKLKELIKQKV